MTRAMPSGPTTATTEFDVPRSIPTMGSLRDATGLLEGQHDVIVPAFQPAPKRPHPSVGAAGELPDDVVPEGVAPDVVEAVDLGGGADALGVPLLLEVRPEPGQPGGERHEQVEEPH